MGDLTRRESDFMAAVRDHNAADGIAPTREELRQALGWKSVSTVTLYLKQPGCQRTPCGRAAEFSWHQDC